MMLSHRWSWVVAMCIIWLCLIDYIVACKHGDSRNNEHRRQNSSSWSIYNSEKDGPGKHSMDKVVGDRAVDKEQSSNRDLGDTDVKTNDKLSLKTIKEPNITDPLPNISDTTMLSDLSPPDSTSTEDSDDPDNPTTTKPEDIESVTFIDDDEQKHTQSYNKSAVASLNKNAISIPVDEDSCRGSQALQVHRALSELFMVVQSGLTSLLDTPLAPLNQRYFGNFTEADFSVPIGLLTRLIHGNKTDILVKCDGSEKTCSSDKIASMEGGYIPSPTGEYAGEDSNTASSRTNVVLCPNSFAARKDARRWIEEICLNQWTLSANNPTVFWSTSLLSLLAQIPTLSSPQMQAPVHAYANVLDLARRDPLSSVHSIYTYLYFVLDVFSQKHIKGGCPGQVSGRVKEIM